MSGRSIASQRPWQIVHSGRERRCCVDQHRSRQSLGAGRRRATGRENDPGARPPQSPRRPDARQPSHRRAGFPNYYQTHLGERARARRNSRRASRPLGSRTVMLISSQEGCGLWKSPSRKASRPLCAGRYRPAHSRGAPEHGRAIRGYSMISFLRKAPRSSGSLSMLRSRPASP